MQRIDSLTAEFNGRLNKGLVRPHLTFTGAGIELGAGTLIVPNLRDSSGVESSISLVKTAFWRGSRRHFRGKLTPRFYTRYAVHLTFGTREKKPSRRSI